MEILILTLSWQEIIIINCSGLCCWTVANTASCFRRATCVLALVTHLTNLCKLLWDDCVRLCLKLLFPEGCGPSPCCSPARSTSSNQDDSMSKTSTPKIREFLMGFTLLLCSLILLFCLKNHCRGALHVRYTPNARWDHGEGEMKRKTPLGGSCWRMWGLGKPSVKDGPMHS